VSEVLRTAIHELYDTELRNLLQTYRSLAVNANGTQRAFYLAIAAHLNLELTRRRIRWTAVVADMLDDGEAGEMYDTDSAA